MDATKQAYEAFRRDFLVASVVTMLLTNIAWAVAFWRLLNKLTEAQDKRVEDLKDGEARAVKLTDRMAVHMDRSSEATVLFLSKLPDKQ